jgi:hypothetical protein
MVPTPTIAVTHAAGAQRLIVEVARIVVSSGCETGNGRRRGGSLDIAGNA